MNIEEIDTLERYKIILNRYGLFASIDNKTLRENLEPKNFNSGIFYRGQSSKFSTIICGLPRESGFIQHENSMYTETLLRKNSEFPQNGTPIENLAKMQHYGMPTRLVDFSINPFIPLFFAVQNVDDNSDSVVYVYKNKGMGIKDDKIKITSLLSTLKVFTLESLQKEVLTIYKKQIPILELADIVNQSYFINFDPDLTPQNIRLKHQCGTFAICGNIVENGVLTKIPCDIDINKCFLRIHIASCYKGVIKKQLETDLLIDDGYIYPELSEWSVYMKSKHKLKELDLNESYNIYEVKDTSTPHVRKKEVKVLLTQQLQTHSIKECVKLALNDYQNDNDLIVFLVASSTENLSIGNFILTGQWLSNSTPEIYSLFPKVFIDNEGYLWESNLFYLTTQDFYDNNRFVEDKNLMLSHDYIFGMLSPLFQSLKLANEIDEDCFSAFLLKHEHIFTSSFDILKSFGASKDYCFSEFLENYLDFSLNLLDIVELSSRQKIFQSHTNYRIEKLLIKCEELENIISKEKPTWFSKFDLDENFTCPNLAFATKNIISFRSNFPLNPNPLNVEFNSFEYFIDGMLFIYVVAPIYMMMQTYY